MSASLLFDNRALRAIELALQEDAALGDLTSESILPEDARATGVFLCKQDGVVAGLEVAREVFHLCEEEVAVDLRAADGAAVRAGEVLAAVGGNARGILKGERTALNFLQRMSGIATLTRAFVDAVSGTRARITDTRKTAPGLRLIDKMAVRLGGGVNHRFGLDDMVLIKDNHIIAAGGVAEAVARCRRFLDAHGIAVRVEVETRTLAEVGVALACGGIDRIMLDNFPLDAMREAVALVAHRVEVEASGGVSLATVRPIAETGVDLISVGALTHSVRALDISLELDGPR